MASMAAEKFGVRLRQVLRALGVTQREVCEQIGVEADTLSRAVLGKNTAINHEFLSELVVALDGRGVSIRWLLTGQGEILRDEVRRGLQEATREDLIGALGRQIASELGATYAAETDKAGKPAWLPTRLIQAGYRQIDREQLPGQWAGKYVPVIGRLAAGEGVDTAEAEEHPPGWADSFIEYDAAPEGAFAVRIVGDSMEPQYRDGDMVVVDSRRPVDSGICCVIVDDDGERRAKLKRMRRKAKRIVLESTNPDYAPMELSARKIAASYAIHDHLPRVIERTPLA